MELIHLFLVSATLISLTNNVDTFTIGSPSDIPEDARLNFTQLATKYGRSCEEHDVTTQDGYILKVFHLPGDRRRPVFLLHGLFGAADYFIIRGNTSLAVTLSNAGYDVWLGNYRGNRYSRRHKTMIPDGNPAFWDFGPDELGTLDLSASIDYVLNETGESKLKLIGYSEGTIASYILLCAKPEYNDKVEVMVALAPVVFLHHLKWPYTELIKRANDISRILKATHQEEVAGYFSLARDMLSVICSQRGIGYQVCMNGMLFPLVGFNPLEYEAEFVAVMFGHLISGSSRKNLLHLAYTSARRVFARFDYGSSRNLREYGARRPPEYDLSRVRVPTHMFTGRNDQLSTLEDVAELKRRLSGVVQDHLMESPSFNHLDYLLGRENHKIVAGKILDIFDSYKHSNDSI